jgi:endonuclease/exonuclease/phosphatase (EEP) superfamily protein YafD
MISFLRRKNSDSTEPASNEPGRLAVVGRWVLQGLNLLCLIPGLLLAAAPFVSPANWPLPTFLALGAPFVLLLTIAWLLVWRLGNWRFSALNVAVILLNYPKVLDLYAWNTPLMPGQHDIRVLSWNVDAFKWDTATARQAITFMQSQKPDLVVLQEFTEHSTNKGMRYRNQIREALGLKYAKFIALRKDSYFGLLVVSRYPIVEAEVVTPVDENTRNGIAYVDVELYGEVVRVYNVHLQSYNNAEAPHLTDEAQTMLASPTTQRLGNIYQRLTEAWRVQVQQLRQFEAQADKPTDNVIVCGDFNNPPHSYIYRRMRAGLQDAHQVRGNGRGSTYGAGLLAFRIDYVLVGSSFLVVDQEPLTVNLSDHRPLLTTLRFHFHH